MHDTCCILAAMVLTKHFTLLNLYNISIAIVGA